MAIHSQISKLERQYPTLTIGLELVPKLKLEINDFLGIQERVLSKAWLKREVNFSIERRESVKLLNDKLSTQLTSNLLVLKRSDNGNLRGYEFPGLQWMLVLNDEKLSFGCYLVPYETSKASQKFVDTLGQLFFKLYSGSELFYSPSMKQEILNQVNGFLGVKGSRTYLETSKLTKLMTLTYDDLRFKDLAYDIAPKADGVNFLIYFNQWGIFLINKTTVNFLREDTSAFNRDRFPALFEGEWIPINRRLNQGNDYPPYLMMVYDCIVIDGVKLNKPREERVIAIEEFVRQIDRVGEKQFQFNYKVANSYFTPDDFFRLNRLVFNSLDSLTYQNDGIVYTPLGDYACGTTFKWKPIEKNTVDLKFKNGEWYATNEKRELTKISLEVDGGDFTLKDGLIYELEPIGKKGWKVLLERIDRFRPNMIDQVMSILKTLRDPVTKETLLGMNLELLKHYHRREKTDLFTYPFRGGSDKGLTLLDIGCGRGGDLSRMRQYKKIYALEPNAEFRHEFKRRADGSGLNITLLNGSGESPINIPQVDVITMMFTLTFFGKDKVVFDGLISNINNLLKPGGYLLIASLDGDLLATAFETWPRTEDNTLIFPASEPAVFIQKQGDGEYGLPIKISLDGTIVKDQIEYPIYMSKMVNVLETYGIRLVNSWIFDREQLLNPTERALTQFYSGWVFIRDKGRNTCENLKPTQKQEVGEIFGYKATRHGTIADGNSLLHSILLAVDDEYTNDSIDDRKVTALKIRSELTTHVKSIYPSLLLSQMANEETGEFTMDWFLDRMSKPGEHLGVMDIEFIHRTMHLNFILFKCNNGKLELYKPRVNGYVYNKDYDWVMLLWLNETHFEPISLTIDGEDVSYIPSTNPLGKQFLETLV